MSSRGQWADAFLRELHYPTTHENTVAVLAWIRSEFGTKVPIPAENNPLATTQKVQGSRNFNRAGVQHFATFEDGVHANARVVLQDHGGYDAIRGTLTAGHDPYAIVEAVSASQWGSHPNRELVETVLRDWPRDAMLQMSDDDVHVPAPSGGGAPPWPGVLLEDYHEGDGTKTWQFKMRQRGWRIGVDDKFGPESKGVAAQFQAEKNLLVDGIVGPVTWAATWNAPIT